MPSHFLLIKKMLPQDWLVTDPLSPLTVDKWRSYYCFPLDFTNFITETPALAISTELFEPR